MVAAKPGTNYMCCHAAAARVLSRKTPIVIALLLLLCSLIVTFHYDTLDQQWQNLNLIPALRAAKQPPIADGIPLRVLFMGASVTRGDVSTGNLGYRAPLHDKMTAVGNPVNFVGSVRLGNFPDNDLEAFPGNRVDQIYVRALQIVPKTKPNLFVLHVGSNDCLQGWDTANFEWRVRELVEYLLKESPRGTVIMSTLLTNTVAGKEACILDVNIQMRRLASALQREGRPVVMAEMHCEQGLPDRPQPHHISPDGTHPFDEGYGMMTEIFWKAILEADERGFFQEPEDNGVPLDGNAEREAEEHLRVADDLVREAKGA
ncbi:Uu.00g051530.m01.CDS01 [Anthostomella pinea]|uniref:Uu.00g051530.m01.CDS01 n=1 Tax=Anthostomella pinea TaxID=933095 RepID=A0AAI8VMA0_9PEZI|nr:Uu.00g051530.m01.CDS01 [Anthostomella pinea]